MSKYLLNLASIDRNKLVGERNKFKENLDIRGHASKDIYGINIGNKIDTTTYMVSAGIPLVTLEKFGNVYNLLNTYQPVSSVLNTNYALSTYSSDWGWPLVLPTSFNFIDIEKYYLFFEYVPQYDNSLIGGVIDFDNSKTTISPTVTHSDLFSDGGIFENMFGTVLYQSLSLIQ